MNPRDFGSTSFSQKIQDIASLLTQGQDRCQNAFDKQTAGLALGPKAASPPNDGPAQGAFGSIIGGFNSFLADKGPQSRLELKNVLASLAGSSMAQVGSNLQQAVDLDFERLHRQLKLCSAEATLFEPVPKLKD